MSHATPSPDPKYEEIRVVRDLVEEAVGVLRYLARDPESMKRRETELKSFFQGRRRMSQVFLTIDGKLTSDEVARALSMRRQNVDRDLRMLRDAGLVAPIHASGRVSVWARNALLEQVLRLSKKVEGWLSQTDGDESASVAQSAESDREISE